MDCWRRGCRRLATVDMMAGLGVSRGEDARVFERYADDRLVFFIEGAVTVLVAMVAFFFLPNTPSTAKYLSPDEQQFAAARLQADLHGATHSAHVEEEKFSWAAVSIIRIFARVECVTLTLQTLGSLRHPQRQHPPHVDNLLPHPHPHLQLRKHKPTFPPHPDATKTNQIP